MRLDCVPPEVTRANSMLDISSNRMYLIEVKDHITGTTIVGYKVGLCTKKKLRSRGYKYLYETSWNLLQIIKISNYPSFALSAHLMAEAPLCALKEEGAVIFFCVSARNNLFTTSYISVSLNSSGKFLNCSFSFMSL